MTILEMYPYIMGEVYTRDRHEPSRFDNKIWAVVRTRVADSETFDYTIKNVQTCSDFMKLQPDIAEAIPRSLQEEMFYSLKLGFYSPEVPAKCIYIMKTLFEKHGSFSLALKALPVSTFNLFFQTRYFSGVTMRDIAKTFCDPDFEPFSPSKLRLKHKDYDEVYVASEDMVALLPKAISEKLTDTDLPRIVKEKTDLMIDGLKLRQMGQYFGAVNSTYDLRELI